MLERRKYVLVKSIQVLILTYVHFPKEVIWKRNPENSDGSNT